MIKLPQKNIWNQNNQGDKFGDLWASQNLDLTSNPGALKVSSRMLLNLGEGVIAEGSDGTEYDTSMTTSPCAFRFFSAASNFLWAIAGAFVWHSAGGPETTFIQDATAGTPTHCSSDQSDLELMNGILFVTEASQNLYQLATNGTWSNASKLSSSSGLHQMVYFKAQNRLYIVDDGSSSIGSLASDGSTYATLGQQYTLNDLCAGTSGSTGSFISWINCTSDKIWIGTISIDGTSGEVYSWNGSTANTVDVVYTLDSNGSLACVIKDDVPIIMDVRGKLLQLNGGTFKEIARLPFEDEPVIRYDSVPTSRMVHYNGMNLVGGNINILVNSQLWDTNSTNKENVPSGIWEYTPETGLYHKASVGLTKSNGVIVDYGQQKLSAVGALQEVDVASSIAQGSINGKFLVGCDYYTDATTIKSGIFYDDSKETLQKAGGFTTSKIFSPNITEIWQRFYIRFKKLLTATDKMVFKYRTSEEDSSEFTITWASTTSFTTFTNIVGDEGYEIEVLSGVGAGRCFHLATTGYNGSNYIATSDETITGATGTAKVRMQNWKKLGSYSAQTEEFYTKPVDTGASTWIQFKVWILSTGDNEINDLTIINVPNQKMI